MPELFGEDFRALAFDILEGQLVPGVLTRIEKTSDPNNLGRKATETRTDYNFEGFYEAESSLIPGTATRHVQGIVSILGGSLPDGFEPRVNDEVEIEGRTFSISDVERDPAAALYRCGVNG